MDDIHRFMMCFTYIPPDGQEQARKICSTTCSDDSPDVRTMFDECVNSLRAHIRDRLHEGLGAFDEA